MLLELNKWLCEVAQGTLLRIYFSERKASSELTVHAPPREERESHQSYLGTQGTDQPWPPLPSGHLNFSRSYGTVRNLDFY